MDEYRSIDATIYRQQKEVLELKKLLFDSDYKIIKFVENLLSCTSTLEIISMLAQGRKELTEIIQMRKSWRAQINELEGLNNAE